MNLLHGSSPEPTFKESLASRQLVLEQHGAKADPLQELLRYTRPACNVVQALSLRFPLPDEDFVSFWKDYAAATARACSIIPLSQWLPQLRFPIGSGISSEESYRDKLQLATSTSVATVTSRLPLTDPGNCNLCLHATSAGHLPVISAQSRADFVTLVRALTKKNEPAFIPDSMGATMVSGYANLHRLTLLHDAFLREGRSEGDWPCYKAVLRAERLYHDRFIILSSGPYSGVPAHDVNLPESQWNDISLDIRLEHECTHYFMQRVFGSMRNHLLDELVADFCGLQSALGHYDAKLALLFFGLEDPQHYRVGGRLENYRGSPPMSNEAFNVLCRLVRTAVRNVVVLDRANISLRHHELFRPASVLTLASFTLEDLASNAGAPNLVEQFRMVFNALTATPNDRKEEQTA